MAFATIQITQGAIVGGSGESVIGLTSDANVTLTDDGGAGANSYLWEIIGFPSPDSAAPTVNNSDTQVATVLYGSGFTDGVYIVRLTRDDPSDGVSTDVRFFAVEDADGLSLPTAGMNYTMSNVGGSAAAQEAGWFGSENASTNVFLDAFLRLRRAREGYSKVSSNDTTFGFLEDKIAAGTGIAVQTLNDGGDESVEVSSTSLVAISPSQITSNQNDYSPTGWSSSGVVRLSTDASRTITGFSATATQSLKRVVNAGSNDLVLAHEDTGSTATNRIVISDGSDLTLAAGQSADVYYDATTTRWRVLTTPGLTVPTDPGDDGKIAVANGGDLEYQILNVAAKARSHGTEYSPLALYNFDEDATDSSGNGLDLDVTVGSPQYFEGAPGLPMVWLDSDNFRRSVNDDSLELTGAITVECILRADRTNEGSTRILTQFQYTSGTEANNCLWDIRIQSDGKLGVYHETGGTPTITNLSFDYWYPPFSLVHIAVTRASDGVTYKLYVNGEWKDTKTASAAPTGGTASRLQVGADPVDSSRYSAGLGSLKIIGSELTAAEVKEEFERTLGPVFGTRSYGGVPVDTGWVDFTPIITGSTTSPTFGQVNGKWRREGDSMQIRMTVAATAGSQGGSGDYSFSLPAGYTIDEDKIDVASATVPYALLGRGLYWDQSDGTTPVVELFPAYRVDTQKFHCLVEDSNVIFSSSNPATPDTNDWFQLEWLVPITGWSVGGGVGGGETTQIIAAAEVNDASPTNLKSAEIVLLDPTYSTNTYFATTSDMAFHLKLNETSGTDYDNLATGSDWTLTVGSATQGATGYIDKSLEFPSAEDAILTAPAESALTGYDYATLMAWVYPTAYPGSGQLGAIIWKSQGTYPACTFGIFLEQAGGNVSSYVNNTAIDFSYIPTLNVWTHLALTYDGQSTKLYVDGQFSESSSAVSGAITWTNPTANLWTIGRPEGAGTPEARAFLGRIEDARAYKRALGVDEILAVVESKAALTGLDSSDLTTRRKSLVNINSTNGVSLTTGDTRSSAANRFSFPGIGLGLPASYGVDIVYANGLWRKVSSVWAAE